VFTWQSIVRSTPIRLRLKLLENISRLSPRFLMIVPTGTPAIRAVDQRNTCEIPSLREQVEKSVRYANITIIEGNEASQFGIGIVAARIAEIVLRDERAVIPIGSYNERFGVTLSLPSIVGREGVVRMFEPEI
jgi:L-lactate dehydrogenase